METVNQAVRRLRKARGYTLETLAAKTGFTKGYLSRIENAPNSPPFATVERIAAALDADLSELLPGGGESGRHNLDLLHGEDRVKADWDGPEAVYAFKPLVNSYKNKYMSPFLFRVQTGSTELYAHDAEEFVYVLRGRVTLCYEKKEYELREGDSFYLDARLKHNFVNRLEQTALLIAVHFNYRRF